MNNLKRLINITLFSATLFSVISAEPLKVGVNVFPPMVVETEKGYSGFDIELWEHIADKLNLEYEYQKVDTFSTIFSSLQKDRFDVALGGISITKDREQVMDFSHGYFDSGLSILIRSESQPLTTTISFYSSLLVSILKILGIYFVYTILCAIVIWFLELDNDMFRRKLSGGLFDGWYWVNVVVTTVGFGDKVPLSSKGRFFGVLLMWTGIFVMVPFINGKIASEMTANKLQTYISSKEDLRGRRVAVKKGTTAEVAAEDLGARIETVHFINEAVVLLRAKEVDAVVTDMPVIKFLSQSNSDLSNVREVFSNQDYGIGLQTRSELRESINCTLLELKKNGTYGKLYNKYFGSD